MKRKTGNVKSSPVVSVGRIVFLASAAMLAGMGCFAEVAATNSPALLQPRTLTTADGKPELDLVDPFRRRNDNADVEGKVVPGEDGLMRTTMGEISSEFRILAITIPQDTNTPRSALIQFYSSDEPILVHEGDLVRVDRMSAANSRNRYSNARNRNRRRNAARVTPARANRQAGRPQNSNELGNMDLEEKLKEFVFYVNVKNIEPTFIEVYHNKKRPDETIRLNW